MGIEITELMPEGELTSFTVYDANRNFASQAKLLRPQSRSRNIDGIFNTKGQYYST